MPTIFISANDTGVGKTWVTAAIALLLLEQGAVVEVIKPVETGISPGGSGDAEWVLEALPSKVALSGRVRSSTLRRFSRPLAPVEAASLDGGRLDFEELAGGCRSKSVSVWRLVEGAGGLSVPLEAGAEPRDWADFAVAIDADYTVLVVEDRLGAINQARLLAHYADAKGLKAGWWLNQVDSDVPGDVRQVNYAMLVELAFPLWGAQDFNVLRPCWQEAPWLRS